MDLPIARFEAALTDAVAQTFDREGKVVRALDAIGHVAHRDVVLLDGDGGRRQGELEGLGAHVSAIEGLDLAALPAASADVVVGCWTGLGLGRATDPIVLAGLERVLRPGGRLLLVEDYGRDDLRALYADDERDARLTRASARRGPMLATGFRLRTLHCWWSFRTVDDAAALLSALFPATGATVAAGLRRPRLEHKVALFHRVRTA